MTFLCRKSNPIYLESWLLLHLDIKHCKSANYWVYTVAWYCFFQDFQISLEKTLQKYFLKMPLALATYFWRKHILTVLFETAAHNNACIKRNYIVKPVEKCWILAFRFAYCMFRFHCIYWYVKIYKRCTK